MNYSEKQIQILNTAEKLFAQKGFDGTSVRDIAEDAGINIAMISYYFGSKEKLMQALFDERANHIKIKIENLIKDEALDPLQKVYQMIDGYVERVFSNQQFYKIMICEQILNNTEVIKNFLADIKQRTFEAIEKLLGDGQQKGVFKKDIDIVLLVNTMTGVVMQTIIYQDFYKNFYHQQSFTEAEFLDMLKPKITGHIKMLFKAILVYEV